jgi:cyclic pyranopterin phosphate synthase
MPPGGRRLVTHDELLRYEELIRAIRVLAGMGIVKIRITGGEPLVRKGISGLLREISSIKGVHELCLTTNGTLLAACAKELRVAGVKRVNVSLDSLRRDRFSEITGSDALDDVLKGLDAAAEAGFELVKINTVLFRGLNDDEIVDFARFSRSHGFRQRFIELMPFRLPASKGVSEREVTETLAAAGIGPGDVEFISQISRPFCSDCGRLRIDSRGRLKACLLSKQYLDLRDMLRNSVTDEMLAEAMAAFVASAEKRLAEDAGRWADRATSVAMSEIGG